MNPALIDDLDAAIKRYAAEKAKEEDPQLDWQDARALPESMKLAHDTLVAAMKALHGELPAIDHPVHVYGVARNGRIYAPTHDGDVLVISRIVNDDGTLARLTQGQEQEARHFKRENKEIP